VQAEGQGGLGIEESWVESSWMFERRFYHPLTISLPIHFHRRYSKAMFSTTGLCGISAVHYIENLIKKSKLLWL
jgi:hypothetical protein